MGGQPNTPSISHAWVSSPILVCDCFFKNWDFCDLFLAASIKGLRSQLAPLSPLIHCFNTRSPLQQHLQDGSVKLSKVNLQGSGLSCALQEEDKEKLTGTVGSLESRRLWSLEGLHNYSFLSPLPVACLVSPGQVRASESLLGTRRVPDTTEYLAKFCSHHQEYPSLLKWLSPALSRSV